MGNCWIRIERSGNQRSQTLTLLQSFLIVLADRVMDPSTLRTSAGSTTTHLVSSPCLANWACSRPGDLQASINASLAAISFLKPSVDKNGLLASCRLSVGPG